MDSFNVYKDIQARTGGEIYIGVVGPVRTGKSPFIKRFMETLVLPELGDEHQKARTRDELPQSAAGRTIMTTEPKFIPKEAASIQLGDGISARVRLIDCVGFMVDGASGHIENDEERLVKTPWFDYEIPFTKAAEIGTRKVIGDHSTIGVVVTTDGSISDIPRAGYQQAEARVIAELEALGKPYVILLNTTSPGSPETARLAAWMQQQYGRAVLPVSCVDLDAAALEAILESVLYEFPVRELDFAMPRWVTMLDSGHWLQSSVYQAALDFAARITRMKDLQAAGAQALDCEAVARSPVTGMDLAEGSVRVTVELKPEVFYRVLSEQTGLEIGDEAGLMPCIIELARAKREYERLQGALEQVEATGYGIVMPTIDELHLEQPEIVRQGGRYGVRLEASAPSIHIIWNKKKLRTEKSTERKSIQSGVDGIRLNISTTKAAAPFGELPLLLWVGVYINQDEHMVS